MPPSQPEASGNLIGRIIGRDISRSEATLQADVRQLLITSDLNLDDHNVVNLEVPIADNTRRRIDIEVGNTVIEVKRDLRKGNVLTEAIDQLAGYLRHKTFELGRRYVGVLTDGRDWYLYNLTPDGAALSQASHMIATVDTSQRLIIWLETILATAADIVPSPEEIGRRLGFESPAYQLDHQYLSQMYEAVRDNPEVKLKRSLWARLLRTAFGSSFSDDPDLFIDHTLLVIQANIIAHAVIGLDLAESQADPTELIRGTQFTSAQINNVVEADFFDWVLQTAVGESFVSNMVKQLRRFAWSNVEHDVLKVLYESVINTTTRKRLGEYYTPDWLAERMVAETIIDPLNQRVLDPACGSGTFVFHAVRQHLAAADAAGMSNTDALRSVQLSVFGMDIHPVSVVLARVTYLLALGRQRLTGTRGSITVPVYLGDSMQWSRDASSVDGKTMRVEVDSHDLAEHESQAALFSAGRVLAFPLSSVDDPGVFDRLVSDLATQAQQYTDARKQKPSIVYLLNQYGITLPDDRAILGETFSVLCDLNEAGENHIWGYFVRNQVRPLWFGLPSRRVDVLVGNPPWVAFKYMTEAMQRQFKRFSQARNLWAGGKVTVTQDLVGLFISRAVEQYLELGGTFAFVAPKAVLSRMQYAGFRSGTWGAGLASAISNTTVSVTASFDVSWDTGDIRPPMFPVPSAVVFGTRSATASAMPIGTVVLSGRLPGRSVRLSVASELISETEGTTHQQHFDGSYKSPYSPTAYQGAIFSPRLVFFVKPRPIGPLGVSSGLVPIESHRTPLEHEPWKSLPSQAGTIEQVFVRNVLMGGTLTPYRPLEGWRAVLPIVGDQLLAEPEMRSFPHLHAWWTKASALWESNKKSNSKLTLMDQLDYQGKLSKQLGKGSHRVVYVASGTTMAAAHVSDSTAIIDNSLYWMNVHDGDSADYLTGILNSAVLLQRIRPLQSEGLFGPRHFHKLPWSLPIPLYNSGDDLHVRLVSLAREAVSVAQSVILPPTLGFQAARRLVSKALNEAELSQEIDELVAAILDRTS